jgi:uncharacterized protein (DUF1778 family)
MDKLRAITVRFTPEEKRRTEQNADAAGLSVSRFLAATGSEAAQPISSEERKLYVQIIVELKRIGNNINQLAAAKNAARRGSGQQPEQSEIEKAGTEVQNLAAELRAKIKIIR